MFSVVNPDCFSLGHSLFCISLGFISFGIGFTDRRLEGNDAYNGSHQTTAQYPVEYYAEIHIPLVLLNYTY